jgi:hypothetical protein
MGDGIEEIKIGFNALDQIQGQGVRPIGKAQHT